MSDIIIIVLVLLAATLILSAQNYHSLVKPVPLTEVSIMWSIQNMQKSQMMFHVIGSDSHVIK